MDNLSNKQKSVVRFLINMGYRKSDVMSICHRANYELVISHKLLSGMKDGGGAIDMNVDVTEEITKKLVRKGFSKKEAAAAVRKGKGDYQVALRYARKVRKKKEKKSGKSEKEKDGESKSKKKNVKEEKVEVRERKSSKKKLKDGKSGKEKKKSSKKKKESSSKKKKEPSQPEAKHPQQEKIDKLWKEFESCKRENDINGITALQKQFEELEYDRGIAHCIKQIGAIHYKKGENENAAKFYIEALGTPYMKKKDDEAVVLERSLLLYTLGLLLFKMGRKEESDQYLRQIKDKKRFMKTLRGIKKGQSIRQKKEQPKKKSKKGKKKEKSKSKKTKEEVVVPDESKKRIPQNPPQTPPQPKMEEFVDEEKEKKSPEEKEKKKKKKPESLDDDVFELSSEESSDDNNESSNHSSPNKKVDGSSEDEDVFQLSDEDDEDIEMYEEAIVNTPIKKVKELDYDQGKATESPAFDVTPYNTPTSIPESGPVNNDDDQDIDSDGEKEQQEQQQEEEVSKTLYESNEKVEVVGDLDTSSSDDDFNEGESEEEEKEVLVQEAKIEEEEEDVVPTSGVLMSPPKKKSEVFQNDQLERESSRMEAEFFGDDSSDLEKIEDIVSPIKAGEEPEIAEHDGNVGESNNGDQQQQQQQQSIPIEASLDELDMDEDFDFPDDTKIMSFEDREKKQEEEEEVVDLFNNKSEEEEEPTKNLFTKPKKEEEPKEEEEEVVDIGLLDSDTEDMEPKREKKVRKKEKKRILTTIEKRKLEFKKLQKTYTIPNYIYLKHMLEEIGALWKDLERYDGSKEEEIKANEIRLAQILTNLGTISFQKKNFVMSVHYFVEAVQFKKKIGDDKNLHIPLNNVGKIFFAQREYGKSVSYFEEAFELNPEYAGVVEYLCKACLKAKKYGRAREVLEVYMKKAESSLNSKNLCWVYRKMGICLAKLGKWQESVGFYRKAIGLVEKEKVREGILRNIGLLEDKIECL